MDWLTYKFCVLIWVLCVSKSQSQLLNSTSSLTPRDPLQPACEVGQPVTPPDECNSCICYDGLEHCTNLPCPEQECVIGEEIPQPDACNKCMCKRGKVVCTNIICIPAPNCAEGHMFPSQNKCNACMCRNGFIRCTSNACTEENTSGTRITTTTTTSTETPKKKHNCTEGSRLPGRHQCVECFCINGRKKCKNICSPIVNIGNRFAETSGPECIPGQHLPKPNECNNCICFEGQIHCTHTPCHKDMRIGQECSDDQSVFRPDECNECHCFEGRLHCSDLVCIRGSKCVEGQVIPKPDSCNNCKCVEGHILCTNHQCPIPDSRNGLISGTSTIEVKPAECQDGDVIPPLPPPYECNACFCIENSILCTMKNCVNSDSELKGRLKEQNEQNHLQIFDKQISVKPFIEILYKNNDKIPKKLIHTHAYNGFHQEIKVHASHLPKDATSLLKALATSLDKSALATISQKLLISPDSLSNNHDSKKPLDYQVIQNNLIGEGNVLTSQSSKLITSGSQSNETILVIPNTEPFDSENPQSALPLTNKHEIIWKTVSAPATIVYHNNPLIQSRNSQEDDLNVYHYDRPSIFSPVQQSDMIRNQSKFSRPGRPRTLPTKPTSDTLELPIVNTQLYPILKPKLINNNEGKMNYAPFYQENDQFKPVPSGFVPKRDELPVYRPGQFITTPNNNGAQQNPSQFQFLPNPSKSYPNQVKPQEIRFKPDQNQPSQIILPTSNNKGYQHPPLIPNTPNQPIVSANQYKPSQFGLKRGQLNPLNSISSQTEQLFKQFPPNFQMIPPVTNLPNQKKRISSFDSFESEVSKDVPIHSEFGPNSAPNILNPQQHGVNPMYTEQKTTHSPFVPNPSIYYKHEYEGPTIDEVNPDKEQLLPYSKLSYTPMEHYNQPHTLSEPGDEANIPKVRNKTKKYNTTHSSYEKHTSITYISEYDPDDPAYPKIVGLEPNQDHNAAHNNEYEHYLPDQNEPHSEINKYHITTHQFDKYPHSPGDGENTDQNKSNQNLPYLTIPVYSNNLNNYPHTPSGFEYKPPQDNSQTSSMNDRGTNDGSKSPNDSVEYPTLEKSNEHLHPLSETGPTQNQYPPGAFDGQGSPPEFQYAHNANQDPRLLKSVHNLPSSKLETPQNNPLLGMLNERGSPDGFQYPSHFSEDPTHPNQNKQKQPNFPFGPTQKQHSPGMLDERGSADGFQYPSHSAVDLAHPNQNKQNHPNSPYGPTQNQHSPFIFDEQGSADGFQYPSHSAEDPTHPKTKLNLTPHFDPGPSHYDPTNPKNNLNIPPQSQFGPAQNQRDPPEIPDNQVKDGYQYAHNANQNPMHLKPLYEIPEFPFAPTPNQQNPETFDERGSDDGFQHPSNTARNPIHSRGNLHIIPQKPQLSPINQIQYPSNSAEHTSHPKGQIQIPPNSLFGQTQHQKLPEIIEDLGSTGGFRYPSNSSEKTIDPKDILYNPPYAKENLQKAPLPQFGPTQNQYSPSFHYPSHSAEIPLHPNQKPPNSPYGPALYQHSPGIFDERGSPKGFQYPSHSAENPLHQKQPNSPYGPIQSKHLPGMLDERGSDNGLQYPSHSAESPLQSKDNQHHPPQSQFLPSYNQYKGNINKQPNSSSGPIHNKYFVEDPTNPKGKLPHSLVSPTQDQQSHSFNYPSHSSENPSNQNKKQPNPPFGPVQNKKIPGMFDERGSSGGFQYPSHSAESPLQTKDNRHHPPQAQFLPSHNQYKGNINKQPNSQFGPTQNKYADEDPTNPKGKLPHSPVSPTQNQHSPSFYYPSYSAENPSHPNQKQPNSPYGSTQNQHSPGIFDDRGSADGFQYPSHSAEDAVHPIDNLNNPPQSQFVPSHNQYKVNKQPNSPFDPTQGQHLPLLFDKQQSSSAEDPINPKTNIQNVFLSQLDPAQIPQTDNMHKKPEFPFGPTVIHDLPEVFDERGSADRFQYPSNSADDPSNLKKNPNLKLKPKIYNDKEENQPDPMSDLYPTPTSNNNNNNNPVRPWMYLDHDQYKPSSFDNLLDGVHNFPWLLPEDHEKVSNIITSTFQPSIELDHDQYKPSSFNDLHNGVHDIISSLPENREKILSTITSAPKQRFKPEQDQYKPSSFDNLYNGIHEIPWPIPYQDNDALGTDAEITTPRTGFKPKENQDDPSKIENPSISISKQNDPADEHNIWASSTEPTNSDRTQFKPHPEIEADSDPNSILPGEDDKIRDYYNQLYPLFNAVKKLSEPPFNDSALSVDFDQFDLLLFLFPGIAKILNYDPEKDPDSADEHNIWASSTEPTNSDSTQFKPHPEIEADTDPNNILPGEDDKIPDYYNQLYPLFNAVKKLSEPPFNDSALSVDQFDLLPFLFPGIAKILNYDPEKDHDDALPVENHDFQRLYPLSKLKAKFKQLPESSNAILNWLKSKLTNPIKNNVTAVKNDIDMTKIFHLLTKLTAPIIKDNTEPQNIPFSNFNPEIIENIMNDFQENTLTTTPPPRTVTTNSYDNRFKPVSTDLEESRPQAPLLKYPDIHIILHQPNNEGGLDLPPYIETDGTANLVTDMDSDELPGPLFSQTFNPRFRHRPKDQKDECGDGTYWISNCHGCTCYFSQPMCFKMHDCELRPFGEPMTCKPYSYFKMGCYACECNGDGVAECDAKDCDPKSSWKSEVSETTATPLPEFNEFFDSKETDTILQYYNHYKKLPKDYSKQDLQAQYPTCERGTSWVSSCHKCECNEHGKHECNNIDDCKLDFDLYGKPGRCKPNTKFYPKTNSMPCVECSCNDEGSPYCPTADHKKQ